MQTKRKNNKLDMKSATISNLQSRIDNIQYTISNYIIYTSTLHKAES